MLSFCWPSAQTDPGFFGANVWARGFLRPSETRDSRTSKGIFMDRVKLCYCSSGKNDAPHRW